MKRFSAFDPPEYVDWKPDPQLVRAFRAAVEGDPERARIVAALPADRKLDLYAGLLRARLHDIQLKRWVRTGVISMIRNAAACCEMGMPLADMLRAYLGSADSPSRGRDLHVGSFSHGVLQPISHVGDMVPVVAGIALTFKMKGEPRVALTWVGDGSTKTATAHEGTNFAAVQKVPAIFIIENNQVALGTRLAQHQPATDRRCSSPRRSGWAGTRRTTSGRRGRRSPPSCSPSGASATRSACTRSTSRKRAFRRRASRSSRRR